VARARVKLSDWLGDLLADVPAGSRRRQRLAVALQDLLTVTDFGEGNCS
jgi:hypothetical protein